MLDIARWGLKGEFPTHVVSAGGRYRYKDDWQTPDTQVITLEFDNNTSATWEGRSCNGRSVEGTSVGCIFYGDTGSMLVDGNGYTILDLEDMPQIDWAAREVAGDLARHHHPAIPCRHGEWLDGVMIFSTGLDPPRFDGRHACDDLTLVAHDAPGSEAPINRG